LDLLNDFDDYYLIEKMVVDAILVMNRLELNDKMVNEVHSVIEKIINDFDHYQSILMYFLVELIIFPSFWLLVTNPNQSY